MRQGDSKRIHTVYSSIILTMYYNTAYIKLPRKDLVTLLCAVQCCIITSDDNNKVHQSLIRIISLFKQLLNNFNFHYSTLTTLANKRSYVSHVA